MCETRDSCCTPSMEATLRTSAGAHFLATLQSNSRHLRDQLSNTAQLIKLEVVRQLKVSKKKTETMFDELYRRLSLLARQPVADLFDQLERFFLSETDQSEASDVSEAVTAMFSELFPRVYGQSAGGVQSAPAVGVASVRNLSAAETQCLRDAERHLRPFGEIPRRLAATLARSLDAARALLSSVTLAVQVLEAGDSAQLADECSSAVLRATYCSACRPRAAGAARVTVPPCRGLCDNVARGCLAAMSDVDQPWNDWIDAVERLGAALLHADLDVGDVLSSVDSRISEAVLYALENAPLLDKKVKQICGQITASPTTSATADATEAAAESAPNAGARSGGDEGETTSFATPADLRKLLESLLPVMASARGFYSHLPNSVCSASDGPFANSTDTDCWNGQRIGTYEKPLSGIGVSAQKYNAEVKVSPRSNFDANLIQLSDRLRRVRQVLISKTVVAPEPEPLLMADFGSASGHGGMEDHGSRHVPGSSDSEPDYSYNMHRYPQVPHRSDDSIADMDDASGSGDSDNDWHDTRFPDQNNNRDNHHHGSHNVGVQDTSDNQMNKPSGCVRLSSSGRMAIGLVLLSWFLLSNVIN